MQKVDAGITRASLTEANPRELLDEVRKKLIVCPKESTCWREVLKPSLAKENIHFKEIEELNKGEFSWLRAYFRREVFPVLTPLLPSTQPILFPLILNKSLNLLVSLRNLRRKKKSPPLKAIVQVPRILPRLVRIPARHQRWVKKKPLFFK